MNKLHSRTVSAALAVVVFTAFFLLAVNCTGLHPTSNPRPEETVLMSGSWSYHYSDLEELTRNSDLIALISVEDANSYITDTGIPMTNYTVTIDTPIYGCVENGSVSLVMTGGPKDGVLFEISDDPLMDIHDSFIIFARQNDSGTYTVLSGPQGRMSIENGLVSSLIWSSISVQDVPLDEFIAEIQSYLSPEGVLRNIYGENLLCEDGEYFLVINKGLEISLTGLDDACIDNSLPYSLSVDGTSYLSRDDDLDGMMELNITFTNDSDRTLSTESAFRIEQELDSKWYYCAATYDDSIEDYFEPNESVSRSCSLANRVYDSEGQRTEEWVNFAPGHYRVLKKVGLSSDGSGKAAYVSAEFTILPDGTII